MNVKLKDFESKMDRIHQHEDHSEGKAEGCPPRRREMSPGKT